MNLPSVEGPKIGPFKLSRSKLNIKFIQEIGEGGDSWVWKVGIDDNIYALKMRQRFRELGITDERAIFHAWDPFSNECRAYGRLKEIGKTEIAASCYGYLLLNTENNDSLDDADFTEIEWAESRDWKHDMEKQKAPVRCLVKEYIESEVSFSREMIPKMLRNLKFLHKYGIVHRDIRETNYREGLLVDFSTSLTVPHYLLDVKLGYNQLEEIYDYEVEDGYAFDNMIDEWSADNGIQIWQRFLPNFRYRKMEVHRKIRDRIKWHAADYDWKKGIQKKRRRTV
ncbi:kinetochore Sim4 complex subunit FTA2-domain-containing protein [Ustulina deusta]|nr:kinetochore Sim4 complex subunit FTA2-domain-containing protein [Ustulina deusta]